MHPRAPIWQPFLDRVRVVSLLASPRRLDASSAWVAHEDQGEACKEANLASIDNLLQVLLLYDCALDMRIVGSDVDWKSAASVARTRRPPKKQYGAWSLDWLVRRVSLVPLSYRSWASSPQACSVLADCDASCAPAMT